MKAQNYRPRIQTSIASARRTAPPAASRSRSTPRRSRRKSEGKGQGGRVIWILMAVGGLIASGFLLAQRSQINAHQLRQAEEKFKTQLEDLSNQQRYLALEKERVLNVQETDRIAKQSGLIQPRLDQSAIQQSLSASPVKSEAENKTAKAVVTHAVMPVVPSAKSLAKPQAAKQAAKSSGNVAPTNKANAVSKSTAKMPTAKTNANAAKANKDSKNLRQVARSQEPKKEKRR